MSATTTTARRMSEDQVTRAIRHLSAQEARTAEEHVELREGWTLLARYFRASGRKEELKRALGWATYHNRRAETLRRRPQPPTPSPQRGEPPAARDGRQLSGTLAVRGVVQNLGMRTEEDGPTPAERAFGITKSILKIPLFFLPDMFVSYGDVKRPPIPPKKTIWAFRLKVTDDLGITHPFLEVEMSGRRTTGVIREGSEVTVTGRIDSRRHVLIGDCLEDVSTGAKTYCTRVSFQH